MEFLRWAQNRSNKMCNMICVPHAVLSLTSRRTCDFVSKFNRNDKINFFIAGNRKQDR